MAAAPDPETLWRAVFALPAIVTKAAAKRARSAATVGSPNETERRTPAVAARSPSQRRRVMTAAFCGLDVSLNSISLCVVDEEGAILLEREVDTEPDAIADALRPFGAQTLAVSARADRESRSARAGSQPVVDALLGTAGRSAPESAVAAANGDWTLIPTGTMLGIMDQWSIMARTIPRRLSPLVLRRLAEFPAVGLLGPRQVGKSTLAKTIAQEVSAGTRRPDYLDLKSPADQAKLDDAGAYLRARFDRLVVIDEVQRAPGLFQVLRAVIDDNIRAGRETGQFLLLGSASIELLKQFSESLVYAAPQ